MAGVAGWVSPGGVSRVRGQALPPSTAPLRNARRHGLGRRDLAKRISFALLLQMQWPARGGHARAAGLDATSTGTTREQGGHWHRDDTGTGPQTLRQCHWYGLRAGPHQNLQGAGAVVRLCLQACSRCPGSMSATSGLLMGRAFPRESEALRVAPCRRSPLGPVDNPRWPSDPAHQEPGSP